MATEQQEEDCLICLEAIQNPVHLPCNHSFCAPCLEGWRSKYGTNTPHIHDGNDVEKTCPKCRRKIPPTKQMIQQLRLHKQRFARVQDIFSKTDIFQVPLPTTNNPLEKLLGPEHILSIAERPMTEHDPLLRHFYQEALVDYAGCIEQQEEEMGEFEEILEQGADETLCLPQEIYWAVYAKNIPHILDWLGPPPIPQDRLDAKNPAEMDEGLLKAAAKTLQIELMSILLQCGADAEPKSPFGTTPFQESCYHMDYNATNRVLLEWGINKEVAHGLLEKVAYHGNTEMANLISHDLGGRRCEIRDLIGRADLNGTTGIVGTYIAGKDRYIVCMEETEETLLIRTANLRRRDRTPEDPGVFYTYHAETKQFSKARSPTSTP